MEESDETTDSQDGMVSGSSRQRNIIPAELCVQLSDRQSAPQAVYAQGIADGTSDNIQSLELVSLQDGQEPVNPQDGSQGTVVGGTLNSVQSANSMQSADPQLCFQPVSLSNCVSDGMPSNLVTQVPENLEDIPAGGILKNLFSFPSVGDPTVDQQNSFQSFNPQSSSQSASSMDSFQSVNLQDSLPLVNPQNSLPSVSPQSIMQSVSPQALNDSAIIKVLSSDLGSVNSLNRMWSVSPLCSLQLVNPQSVSAQGICADGMSNVSPLNSRDIAAGVMSGNLQSANPHDICMIPSDMHSVHSTNRISEEVSNSLHQPLISSQDMPVDVSPSSRSPANPQDVPQNTANTTTPLCNGSTDDFSVSTLNESHVIDFSSVASSQSDIILEAGEKQFLCHKRVLCQESLWFQAMFESGMKESRSEKVHLSETDPKHFQILLHYFYTGELKLTESNVNGLTELSSMYQASKPLKLCCDFLITIIEDDLCLSLMRMANFLMLTDVYNHARRHALWHFDSVSQVEDFFLAPAAQLVDYLQDPYLNIDSEVDVFRAASTWYHAQEKPCEVTDIANFFADTVNFHLLKEEDLKDVQDLPVVQKDKELSRFAASLSQQDVMTGLSFKHPSRKRTSPKNGRILCVGGHQCRPATCSEGCLIAQHNTAPLDIVQFHPNTCSLQPLASLFDVYHTSLALDSGYRVCAIGHLVYVCGGEAALGRSAWLNTIWCLDTLSGTWREAGQLRQPRRHHGLCAHKNTLYLIGGIGRYRIRLATLESFDTTTQEWAKHPDMLHQETAPAVTEHNGFIYVFKNCFQMYNIARQTWSYLQLYPSGSVPGLPVYAHIDAEGRSIFVSCFNSETLWQVDLGQLKCQRMCDFENEGGGAVLCVGCVYHFQLYDSHGLETEVECYNWKEKRRSRVGSLCGAVLSSHFVTVPYFPDFVPSSKNRLC